MNLLTLVEEPGNDGDGQGWAGDGSLPRARAR